MFLRLGNAGWYVEFCFALSRFDVNFPSVNLTSEIFFFNEIVGIASSNRMISPRSWFLEISVSLIIYESDPGGWLEEKYVYWIKSTCECQ